MVDQLVLTTQQLVAAITDLDGEVLPVRTLAQWGEQGIVTASVKPARGRRATRLYNLADLAKARLVLQLRRRGLSLQKVRVVLMRVENDLQELLHPTAARRSDAMQRVLVVKADQWSAVLVRGSAEEWAVQPLWSSENGQMLLPLADVLSGNEEAARKAVRVA